ELVPEEGEGSFLEFSAADCVQCNLCADACLKSCLTVSSTVSTEELFDFEPRLIHLPNPPARPGILSSLRR
ncbi:MAG: 4Fe-4S ferredoxin, partial [Eggerthella sp.]|nr:4Fe-4S ferredoxin [Eggerthella sp.]